jgi:hypothetical protein
MSELMWGNARLQVPLNKEASLRGLLRGNNESQKGHSEIYNFPVGKSDGSGQIVLERLREEFSSVDSRNSRIVQVPRDFAVRFPQ